MRTDAEIAQDVKALAGAEPKRVERRGSRALAELADRIAWVPLDDVGRMEIAREDRVLRAVAKVAGAPVAFPHVIASDARGSVRTRLEGFPALKVHRQLLENELRTRAFAAELAGLAVWLHRVPAAELALPGAQFNDGEVRAGIEHVARFEANYGALASGVLDVEQPRCAGDTFLHGDLGSHNLLLDSRGHASGLVDFADARAGDRHYELRWLPSYGELFLASFVDAYRRASGVALDTYRVRRLHALVALEQLGWGVREPEQHHRTGRTLDQTRQWACAALDALELVDA
jgi:aminoglycoside phosphotransferase (APT) family kinase protein